MRKTTILDAYLCKQTAVVESGTVLIFATEHDNHHNPIYSNPGQWWYVYMQRSDGFIYWKQAWSDVHRAQRDFYNRKFVRKSIESLCNI